MKKLTNNFHEQALILLIFTSAEHEWKLTKLMLTSENYELILNKAVVLWDNSEPIFSSGFWNRESDIFIPNTHTYKNLKVRHNKTKPDNFNDLVNESNVFIAKPQTIFMTSLKTISQSQCESTKGLANQNEAVFLSCIVKKWREKEQRKLTINNTPHCNYI